MKVGLSRQIEKQGREQLERVKKKIHILHDVTDMTNEEVQFTVDFCDKNEINIEENIKREGLSFLKLMREMMSVELEVEQRTKRRLVDSALSIKVESDSKENGIRGTYVDYDQKKVVKTRRRKRRKTVKTSSDVKREKRTGYNLDGSKRVKKILLDDALKNKDTNMSEWSEARKRAYKAIKQNPNSYHYRFNKPGETQAKGTWTADEHTLFMVVLLEKGANKNWGLFSIEIKGRVGYQCSNYYRLLVKSYKI